jgi:hypothetical protein
MNARFMPARVIALNGDGRNLLSDDREERHNDGAPPMLHCRANA